MEGVVLVFLGGPHLLSGTVGDFRSLAVELRCTLRGRDLSGDRWSAVVRDAVCSGSACVLVLWMEGSQSLSDCEARSTSAGCSACVPRCIRVGGCVCVSRDMDLTGEAGRGR